MSLIEIGRTRSGQWIRGLASENIQNRDVVYIDSDESWSRASADSGTDLPVMGIALSTVTAGNHVDILLVGSIQHTDWAWTPGAALYLSDTPGALTETAPLAFRVKVGKAYRSNLIYFNPEPYENLVYWSDEHRSVYGPTGVAKADEVLAGGEWWTVNKSFGEGYTDNFNGIFDITGLGVASVISNYAYYATKVGAGTFLANTGASSGMRITTGALANNSNLIATGDATGIGGSWNPTQTVWMHLHYRFPNAGDAANSYFLGAFYRDANNYVGIRYDTAVDTNLRLVTRAAAAETLTVVGPLDTDWHEIYVKFATGEVRFCQDGGTVVVHTANVPVGNFAWYTYLETLANAAKNYDVSLLTVWQDRVEP